MDQIATLSFIDRDTKDEAVAIVRAEAGVVGLALSLRTNGDMEVFMASATCQELISALQLAEATASDKSA